MNREIKDTLNKYYELLTPLSIREQLGMLYDIINHMTQGHFNVKNTFKPITDREVVDCLQECYSLVYCLITGLKYETFDIAEYLDKDRYFKYIAEYKMEHFADEIFQELGFEIVKKSDKGLVLKENQKDKKIIL